ncbi:hypothetical protein [Vibrio aquaticus]|uniref:hypothetical protein n=1 Tax=Vibrio aquaticus TaxID=2496559 RepID=UPI00142E7232|nr:hypothetical protein [Vibrio aquaticus]
MIKAALVIAAILQIIVAIQTDGLIRALAELSAFLLIAALVWSLKPRKQTKFAHKLDDY